MEKTSTAHFACLVPADHLCAKTSCIPQGGSTQQKKGFPPPRPTSSLEACLFQEIWHCGHLFGPLGASRNGKPFFAKAPSTCPALGPNPGVGPYHRSRSLQFPGQGEPFLADSEDSHFDLKVNKSPSIHQPHMALMSCSVPQADISEPGLKRVPESSRG